MAERELRETGLFVPHKSHGSPFTSIRIGPAERERQVRHINRLGEVGCCGKRIIEVEIGVK